MIINGCNSVKTMKMNRCNSVRTTKMSRCNGVRNTTMNGCNGVRTVTINGCNSVRSMKMVTTERLKTERQNLPKIPILPLALSIILIKLKFPLFLKNLDPNLDTDTVGQLSNHHLSHIVDPDCIIPCIKHSTAALLR